MADPLFTLGTRGQMFGGVMPAVSANAVVIPFATASTNWGVAHWLVIVGCGAFWLGAQIIWVGGLPRMLRSGEVPTAPPGTPGAFQLFWLDQYSFIGLTLAIGGIALAAWGLLRCLLP